MMAPAELQAVAATPETGHGAHADCCARCTLEREWLRVRRSPVLAAGGLAVYQGLFDSDTLTALEAEAAHGTPRLDTLPEGQDLEAVRGGSPARRLSSVSGGPVLAALYGSAPLAAFIGGQVGAPVRPCGEQATFSIYNVEGAQLGIHRDVKGCDLTLITCLADNDPDANGGCTEAWPADLCTPLDELRRGACGPSLSLALQPGHAMLLHGGLVPHRIRATAAGRRRIVALMCFEMLA
jgi:hypothetical protein